VQVQLKDCKLTVDPANTHISVVAEPVEMDSSDDEGTQPTMMERETQKVQDGSWKAGYAEGKDEGRREEFQATFNKGYELAFRISMQFGLLQGMLE
jgi:flagellar biosynthesis/type III secretory pathway protein FliH